MDFFRVMGIQVRKGPAFTAADRTGDLVVIVNRTVDVSTSSSSALSR